MDNNEYEQAWGEGEAPEVKPEVVEEVVTVPIDSPATTAIKKAAQESRDAQAKEFSEAFFDEDLASQA